MTSVRQVALGTWMLDHLSAGPHADALAGDLLEQLRTGRSVGWYWRQVIFAVVASAVARSRTYVLPAIFSAGWSTLYPAWIALERKALTQFMPGVSSGGAEWPHVALLQLASGVLPALAFVWVGLFAYLQIRPDAVERTSILPLLQGLSAGLNVLLLATLILLRLGKEGAMELRSLTRENFYSSHRLFAISVPFAFSLFLTITGACRNAPRRVSLND